MVSIQVLKDPTGRCAQNASRLILTTRPYRRPGRTDGADARQGTYRLYVSLNASWDADTEACMATMTVTLVDMLTDSNISIQESWHRLGVRITALEGRIWVVFEPSKPGTDVGVGSKEPAIVSAIFGFGPGAMPLARCDSAKPRIQFASSTRTHVPG